MSKISRRDFVQGFGAFAMLPLARTEPDLRHARNRSRTQLRFGVPRRTPQPVSR
jgi:hypothetical protein